MINLSRVKKCLYVGECSVFTLYRKESTCCDHVWENDRSILKVDVKSITVKIIGNVRVV